MRPILSHLRDAVDSSPIKILTLNSGSSSLKFAIYQVQPEERLLLSGKVERIGLAGGHLEFKGPTLSHR